MSTDDITQPEIDRLTRQLEASKKAITINRSIYKWVLDLLRNCMVAATLAFLARRSGDWWMYGFAGLSALSLIGYTNSYVDEAIFDLNTRGLSRRIFWLIWFAAELTTVAVSVGLFLTIDRIVSIQALRP